MHFPGCQKNVHQKAWNIDLFLQCGNSSKVSPNSFLMAGKWATSEGWKGRSASETCEKSKHSQFLSTIFNRKKVSETRYLAKRDIDEIKGHEKHMAMVNNLYEGGRTLQRWKECSFLSALGNIRLFFFDRERVAQNTKMYITTLTSRISVTIK